MNRRAFVTGTAASMVLGACARPSARPAAPADDRFAALAGFCDGVDPISVAERERRVADAQALLREAGLSALLLEAGDSLRYFTGVPWGRSERPLLCVIPADGAPSFVAPAFERHTLQERVTGQATIHVWEEDESPYTKLALAADGAPKIAVDPWTRQFIADGVRALGAELTPATPLLRSLRSIKRPAELALLRRANEATKAALKAVSAHVSPDMSEAELAALVHQAQAAAGLTNTWALVLFGANASYPHGTRGERRLRRGDLILVDAGGALHDYCSDITRTWPFGQITTRQAEAWRAVHAAQTAALAELRPGRPCEAADAAARRVIAAAGFGEGYASFTHRLGHGIGVQTHEDPYLVGGNRELLRAGMTMSNEPGVYFRDDLGVRLEDIVAITDGEPEVFGPRAAALDAPFG